MEPWSGKKTKLTAAVLGAVAAGLWCHPASAAGNDGDLAVYDIGEITVEAKRPDWEEKLSPGTVTVIRPEEFKGEQKTLPDFLQMVPGVHVREVQGKGQYTTVTVRGSTAAQVGVFVDGVLTNLGGDAAVDISSIPVSNVERIEVYRGYIPARFAGTFIGGVINVVTKKPKKAHGSAEIGPGSFGSMKASVEVTAPLGAGSLLFGYNRESRDGDFPYHSYAADQFYTNTGIGRQIVETRAELKWLLGMTPAEKAAYEAANYPGAWQDMVDVDIQWLEDNGGRLVIAADDPRRRRQYNDYRNSDILIKWQNDDWMIKGTYKTVDRHLPDSLWVDYKSYFDMITPGLLVDKYDLYKYDKRHQTIKATELFVQRRYRNEKLEWGWMVDYLRQSKDYRAENIDDALRKQILIPMREWSRYRSHKYNVQVDGTYQLGSRNMLDFQMNYSHERMNIAGDGLDKVIDDVQAGIGNLWAQMRDQFDQNIFNAQIQDTITLDSKGTWHLTPSLRFNRSQIIGYSRFGRFNPKKTYRWVTPKDSQVDQKVTWQLALKKHFNDHLTMRMTGGTYFRLLNMYEIAGDGAGILPSPIDYKGSGAKFPQPEYGKQFDLSAIWDGKFLGSDNRTTLTYFWRDTERMLYLYRAGLNYSSYFNDMRGQAHGIELQTNFHWKKFDLDVEGTHLKLRAQRRDSSPGVHYDWFEVRPTYQPEWEGNIRLTYRPTENWLFFGEMHYVSQYYTHYAIPQTKNLIEKELAGRPRAALKTVNVGLKWSPRKNMTLSLGCNDVFDEAVRLKVHSVQRYLSDPSWVNIEYPLQGRSYYMTVRYEF